MDGTLAMKGLHSKMAKNATIDLVIGIQVLAKYVIPSSTITPILVKKVRVKQETLCYRRNDENKCVDVSKDYENYFNTTVLENKYTLLRRNFTQPYKGFLLGGRNWGADPPASRSLNLYDKSDGIDQTDLADHNKYPTAVVELLRIHAKLCEFHKLDHFYREYLVYFAYGEQADSAKEKSTVKKRSLVCISHQERMTNMSDITEGVLAAFLAFWLSYFVLSYGIELIRPETFIMASLMASGQRTSLAPMMLGYIYHGLGEAVSHPDHLGKVDIIFPNHYGIGWLAELFPCLYRRCLDSGCPGHFPTMLGSKLSLCQAKHILRDGRYLSLRSSTFYEDSRNGQDAINKGLPDEDFKFLLSIWSFVLPVQLFDNK
ncbi:hypothetical protein Cgig2_009226 [Carnegiea gigantea]|uniref:Aminotransferase-like plant mobile domain-containing protein n=1 Tax=Carnegiea gigantea TaxID=171969 RepID=A0A9Q1KA23_9CARY|nr:hypothetical protein Cgig2_009226 [Carnegiea gigantea]